MHSPVLSLYYILWSMRPRQWIKNVFVLPALVFSEHLFELSYLIHSLGAALCFVLLRRGRLFVQRHLRPPVRTACIPRSTIDRLPLVTCRSRWLGGAWLWSRWFLRSVGAFWLHPHLGWVAALYAALNAAYSLRLKHVVLVDVLIVAACYLLRAVGGGVVIEVSISTWVYRLYLRAGALHGRRSSAGRKLCNWRMMPPNHRAILEEYSVPFLDQMIAVLTAVTVVCYALYAMGVGDAEGAQMQWTIPFVLYGVLRYLYLVYHRGQGDDPTAVVWSDRPLQINTLLWLTASLFGLYT